jgi:uncharacterized protein YdaT
MLLDIWFHPIPRTRKHRWRCGILFMDYNGYRAAMAYQRLTLQFTNDDSQTMPWTKRTYPVSMKNLPKGVRDKAVEIGNALLGEKRMDEGRAIATAISRAKDWAANRGKKTESTVPNSRSTDVKKHGEDGYVIPYKEELWAVKKEGSARIEKSFPNKRDAIKRAREKARAANASVTIQTKSGQVQQRVSYNPNKRARKLS